MRFDEWLRSLFPLPSEPKVESSAPVEALLEALKDARPDVRRKAVLALAERCEGRAPEGIIEALDDPDDEVRLAAVVSLGKIGDPRAVEPLIAKLKATTISTCERRPAIPCTPSSGRSAWTKACARRSGLIGGHGI